jgi:Uma2 family endonuclease
MSTQPVRNFAWDVDRYHRAIDSGVFTSDDRIELVEGELIPVPPIGPAHQSVVDELSKRLVIALGDEFRVRTQGLVTLPPTSEPQPDILVARAGAYFRTHPGPEDSLIVIEVSDTSRARDESAKLPLYAHHRIPEFWLVDVDAQMLHVYSKPVGDGYAEHVEVRFADGRVSSPTLERQFHFDLPHGS